MPKRDQKSVANVTSNLEKHKREVIENGRFKIQKKEKHNNMRFLSHRKWDMMNQKWEGIHTEKEGKHSEGETQSKVTGF